MSDDILTADHRDALGEMFNIAIGRTSKSLAELLDVYIEMCVPSVRLTTTGVLSGLLRAAGGVDYAAAEQTFTGSIKGQALLVFDRAGLSALQRLLLDEAEIEDMGEDVAAHEVLHEIGNVVMTTTTGTLAELLGGSVSFTAPVVLGVEAVEERLSAHGIGQKALIVDTEVKTVDGQFNGRLVVLQDLEGASWLTAALDAFLDEIAAA